MSDLAQPLGERLKAERERRGMSTQKVADEMHLDAWVIDALEAGDYQRIGPSVYAKGHLKKYASILGLSPAEITAGYEPKSAPPMAVAPPPASMRMRSAAPDVTDLPWRQIAAAAAIVLGVGGILWWRPWQQRSGAPAVVAQARSPIALSPSAESPGAASASSKAGSSRGAQDAQRSPEPENSVSASTEPVVAASAAAVLAKSTGTASAADAMPGAGPARLRLSFSADSWVDVHDSTGRRVFAGNGRANSVKTIAGTAPLKVYLGFASGVQLEVNERAVAIGPQFVTGDVARFEAGADGVLRRDSRALPANGVQTRTASPRG